MIYNGCLTPLSTIFQLYLDSVIGDQQRVTDKTLSLT